MNLSAGTGSLGTFETTTVTSTGPSDVAFAALAGATDLVHGVVPYGHIPGFILHGDTYPLLTYAVYVPAAAVMPVTDLFEMKVGLAVTVFGEIELALIGEINSHVVENRSGLGVIP